MFPGASVEFLQLAHGEAGDPDLVFTEALAAVGCAVERRIVDAYELLVGGLMEVELNHLRSFANSRLKGRQTVFREVPRVAAVCDGDRCVGGECMQLAAELGLPYQTPGFLAGVVYWCTSWGRRVEHRDTQQKSSESVFHEEFDSGEAVARYRCMLPRHRGSREPEIEGLA